MIRKPKTIPTHPGIYIFRQGRTPLYVGKALNIKKRLVNYFPSLARGESRAGQNRANLPPKIQKMLEEATGVTFKKTESEIAALIEEANLIKQWRPKYNVLMRDDKNYFYVAITKETYPHIFVTHQPYKERIESREQRVAPHYVGPFTEGSALYATLKLLRRIFPYCTCKGTHKRPCLNSEIGKCPGYCCYVENREQRVESRRLERRNRQIYRRNIQNITYILSGKRTRLLNKLKRDMKGAVRKEQYERAAVFRDQIFGLEGIFAHQTTLRLPKEHYPWPMIEGALRKLLKIDHPVRRIEGYDISNISGTEATGSMIVFVNGIPDKREYRKFKIKTVTGSNDVAMHQEVIRRRLNHPEWTLPDIMVIDGGKPQLNAVLKVMRSLSPTLYPLTPPLVTALAKREEILFRENGSSIYLKREEPSVFHLFQRIRDESHRFARNYHHKLREKQYRASVA